MATSPLILLIDSDIHQLRTISLRLQRAGFLVITETDTGDLTSLSKCPEICLILIHENLYPTARECLIQLLMAQDCYPECGITVLTDVPHSRFEGYEDIAQLYWDADDFLPQISALLALNASTPQSQRRTIEPFSYKNALADSQEQLFSILDGMDADLYVSDMDTHEIIFMNEHMCATFGDDFTGKQCYANFRGYAAPCLDCTSPRLLDDHGNPDGPVTWEGQNPIIGHWYINYDRAIKWVDGRYVRLQVSTDITDLKLAEEALIQERNRAQQYLDIAEVMIFALDLRGDIILANRKTSEVLGLPKEEIIGKNWFDTFIPEAPREEKKRDYQRAVTGEIHVEEHYRETILVSDGTEHIVYWHTNVLKDEDGRLTGVLSSGEVITDRVKTEMALLRSEDRLAKTLLASNDGMWDWDLVTDEVYFDDRYYTMAGYEVDAFPHSLDAFVQRIHPDDANYVLSEVHKHLDGETERYRVEFRFQKAEGSYLWVMGRGIVVERDDDGTPLRLIGTHTDISLRKSVEETRSQLAGRVRMQAQQMAQILATVPNGVLLLNGEGRVLQMNQVANKELYGLTGAGLGEVIEYVGDHQLHELFTSPTTGVGWHDVHNSGRIYEVIARPVEVGIEPEHWVLVLTDVTKAREIQLQLHQREQLAAVGQLAAGIAHDFNNILASIVLYAQLMSQSKEMLPTHREWVQIIDRQALSAAQLVEQMLDFSRRSVLARRPLDLLPLIKEQVKMLQRSLPEHISVQLEINCTSCVVNADPTRMQQMLMNLAVNARDAMPNGGVLRFKLGNITVTDDWSPLLPQMEPGPWVYIIIEDTGTGIAPDVIHHIFEPFFTTKEPGKGSGLGLPQVHGIVGQHGGRISVDTIEGKGTTFSIYLPAVLQKVVPYETEDREQALGQGETLLVVEDNAILRGALADSMEQLGYQVLVASQGQEALDILDEHSEIALVLSDLVMPVMGGQAMFQALRAQGNTIPVVMLTGHPMRQELEGLRKQGLSGWMIKPPDIDELSILINQVLRKAEHTG